MFHGILPILQNGENGMIDFVIEMFFDIAEVFVDLWINKIIAKFKRKK